jgi:hypothetical protein
MNLKGLCKEKGCQRYLQGNEGLFCANFWSQRGTFAPCLSTWRPPCYKPVGLTCFPVALQYNDEGELITSEQENARFREARVGDHLMTPFQCEVCHFRNIYKRDPMDASLEDCDVLEFMRQAITDSLWSREPTTVRANLKEAQ